VIGAQHLHREPQGAFTGEISSTIAEESNIDYTLIGHSERRQFFAESDEIIADKVLHFIHHTSLTLMICIGETLKERQEQKTFDRLEQQLSAVFNRLNFNALSEEQQQRIRIAYEPVWAIGTGQTATPEQAEEVHAWIRHWLSQKIQSPLPLLYGGSVTPQNAMTLLQCPSIDGVLVGGASLKADSFLKIIESAIKITDLT
jgi:triosephosphate isomerase